jgi:hypothetical protein
LMRQKFGQLGVKERITGRKNYSERNRLDGWRRATAIGQS